MDYKVHSIHSEQHILTPILKSVSFQFSPFARKITNVWHPKMILKQKKYISPRTVLPTEYNFHLVLIFIFHFSYSCLEGLTSTHTLAILTKKVVPKNPGTGNARLSFYVRKFTTQMGRSFISTPHLSFTYFIKGFYHLTSVL